jgi:hypothetical protein
MSISDEEKFHQEISITHVYNICASPHAFPTCTFHQSSDHQINNCPYQSSSVLLAHIILTNHKLEDLCKTQ